MRAARARGRQGSIPREPVCTGGPTPAELHEFFGEDVKTPIRVYVGLNSAETVADRARGDAAMGDEDEAAPYLGLASYATGDAERERQYRTHWLSAEISENQRARLVEKASRPPELVVIQSRHAEWTCHRCGGTGGLLIDADSEGPAQAFASYLAQQKQEAKDPNVGRKLARLMRQAGFSVDTMTASYEVISDLLMKIGPLLAGQFTSRGDFCSLQNRSEKPSLFVALAWCAAIGHAV